MAHGEILSCRTYILNNAGLCSKKPISCWTFFTIDGSGTTCVPPYPSVLARSRIDLMDEDGVLWSNWCTVDAFASFPKLPSSRFSGHRGFYNRVWRSCLSKITTSTITCPNRENIAFKWINWVFGVALRRAQNIFMPTNINSIVILYGIKDFFAHNPLTSVFSIVLFESQTF